MTTGIFVSPLKLAAATLVASAPVLWWAAQASNHPIHVLAAAVASLVAVIAGALIGRCEVSSGLEPARRTAARHALLVGLVYLWGSAAILISYYLTDLAWYHAYQYAAYLAVPGIVSLTVFRRHQRPGPVDAIRRDLGQGRRMAWVQIAAMLAILAYMLLTEEASKGLVGHEPNWAAVDLFFCGAIALALISLIAIRDDRRLRAGPDI